MKLTMILVFGLMLLIFCKRIDFLPNDEIFLDSIKITEVSTGKEIPIEVDPEWILTE